MMKRQMAKKGSWGGPPNLIAPGPSRISTAGPSYPNKSGKLNVTKMASEILNDSILSIALINTHF